MRNTENLYDYNKVNNTCRGKKEITINDVGIIKEKLDVFNIVLELFLFELSGTVHIAREEKK